MKRSINKLFISVILLFSCADKAIEQLPITTNSEKARKHYQKAREYYLTTDFPEGWSSLDSALAIDPNFAMASLIRWHPDPSIRTKNRKKAYSLINTVSIAEKYILKSNRSEDEGNLDSALYYVKKLVEEYPNSYESYNQLGVIYGSRNELKLAEQAFKKSLEIYPNNYMAYTYLFGQHVPYGFYDLLPTEERDINIGLKYAEKLIELKPNSAHGFHAKANCYRQEGEFEKAIPLYDKAVELSKGTSSEATENYVSGHNIMFAGDFDKARERYKQALKVVNEIQIESSIKTFITISYLFQRNFEGALDNLYSMEEALNNNKNIDSSYLLWQLREIERLKFICYAHNQMEKESQKALEKTIELNQEFVNLSKDETGVKQHKAYKTSHTAWNDILFGNYVLAKERLDELNKIVSSYQDPTALWLYNGLMGMLHLMEGNPGKGEIMFEKADNRNPYFNYFKALTLKANGKKEEAKTILSDISNENFSYLELSLVKELAKSQLDKI